jgi:site-specific DNA-cytosine methylase
VQGMHPQISNQSSTNTETENGLIIKRSQLSGGNKKRLNILELFKGTGSVGKIFKDFNVVSVDLDPIFTPTIETDILKWDYKKFFKDSGFKPDFIWGSPPCNTFSPLAYPLKERDPQTAEPKSERARIGTKILYRTLDIINYVKKNINPNVLFVLENPRGMMRKDAKMKKFILNTTYYCLYGDKRLKPTDFFSNFDLQLKPAIKNDKCKNTVGVVDLPLNERYKIPGPLIKQIKKRFLEEYKH